MCFRRIAFVIQTSIVTLFLLSHSFFALAESSPATYPADPFAWNYEPISATEIGTAPGQVQMTALAALVSGKNSEDNFYFAGKLGTEYILNEYGGVRFTIFQDLFETDGHTLEHKFTSLRVGPAFHLLPYRKVDVGTYIEGGLLIVDAVDGETGSKAPEAVLGGFISFHVNTAFFVRAELERAWSNAEVDNVLSAQHRSAALLGFGFAF